MISGFLLTILTFSLVVYNKVVQNVNFPDWFTDMFGNAVLVLWDLNGVFPVHVAFEFVGVIILINLARLLAIVFTFILNLFRGSGASPPI